MKSYKELMNLAVNNELQVKKISQEDAVALKRCILDIYKTVSTICESNGLTLMLAGGSCLGAIRHQGYIPWDDDLDVMMPRADYEKFIKLCENGVLGDKYLFRHPLGKEESISMFMKVYYKNSKVIGFGGERTKYPQGCYMDVFPIDGYSQYKLIRKIKGWIANAIRLIANMVLEAGPLTPSKKALYDNNPELRKMMRMRRILGKMFSVVSHRKWIRMFDHFVRCDRMIGLLGLPTGRKLYNGEVFSANVFLPPTTAMFEGIEVKIPANYDEYLKNLYHDYMALPPVEKRESHFVVSVEIPSQFYK